VKFRGHCVPLPYGGTTIKNKTSLLETQRYRSALLTIKRFFPNRALNQITLNDYGCFEGGYSLAFALAGLRVTGIEGRQDNVRRSKFLKASWNLLNLDFILDDLTKPDSYQSADISFVSGLLYHLEKPVEFLKRISASTKTLLILNTHYSEESIPSRFRHKLGPLTKNEDFRGRWYEESTDEFNEEDFPRSSLTNKKSFWLTKSDLFTALRSVGFNLIFEQYDCHYDMDKAEIAIRRNSRSQFLALK
jgi:hypothetical protein